MTAATYRFTTRCGEVEIALLVSPPQVRFCPLVLYHAMPLKQSVNSISPIDVAAVNAVLVVILLSVHIFGVMSHVFLDFTNLELQTLDR